MIKGMSTQNNHEEAHFKQRKSGVFPELEVKKGPRVSPWEPCSLGDVGNDHNGNLESDSDPKRNTLMKPAILNDHWNPMDGLLRRWLINMGQTTPPIEEPEYTIPMAKARFRRNQ
jgi:hypothetical protein